MPRFSKNLVMKPKLISLGFMGKQFIIIRVKKISKQLGDGSHLLSQLTKNIVNNFRDNDIKNGGEGAPLTPIFHQLIVSHQKFKFPVGFLNIGGISKLQL